MWVSSGAAAKAYTAWGAYGSSKAALESISAHLAVEEPDITSIAVSPGRVDTDMQRVIREDGRDVMDAKDHSGFSSAFEQGQLLKPEQPGHVMAKFILNPDHSLSGKSLRYEDICQPCHLDFPADSHGADGKRASLRHTKTSDRERHLEILPRKGQQCELDRASKRKQSQETVAISRKMKSSYVNPHR